MKKILICAALVWMVGCGSGDPSSDQSANREIQVRAGEPSALASLSATERQVHLTFNSIVDGVEGSQVADITLTSNADRTAWNGQINSLAPGRYRARVYISQNISHAALVLDVAMFDSNIDVVVGQSQIIIDVAPAQFSMSLDDDGDGSSNLNELVNGTDPKNADSDGDGVSDSLDAFPNSSAEFGDRDHDGIGDNTDNCLEVVNVDQADNDHDHIGDACDPDDDNDGLLDADEASHGGISTNPDTDGDSILDGGDNCVTTVNPDQIDTDGDHLGNACDLDDDNDGIADSSDNCPQFASSDLTDTNHDGIGDVCTNDDDGDGVMDSGDNCRTVANPSQTDTDRDGAGDACDADDDNDTLTDVEEDTPGQDNLITNRLLADSDGDGILDAADNCRITPNADQASSGDTDGEGDACDCNQLDANIRSSDAVFVSPSGNDVNFGARNAPVRSLSRGIEVARLSGKSKVYVVAGLYEGSFVMSNGISIYGGFNLSSNGSTCEKRSWDGSREINKVVIRGNGSSTINFANISSETRLEGVRVESTSTANEVSAVSISKNTSSSSNNIIIENSELVAPNLSTGRSKALSVINDSPLVMNTVIDAGDSQESIAVDLQSSPATKLIHNTIRGGNASSTATVIRATNSVPAVINNILFTLGGISQRILFFDSLTSAAVIKNNLMFGELGAGGERPTLYQDQSPSLRILTRVSALNSVDGAGGNVDGNIVHTSTGTDSGSALTFNDLFLDVDNYRLISGALALDRGLNPADVVGIQVLRDHDFVTRPQGGARDLGAFERIP